MADYPASQPTFTTKTNKVDLVDASHINKVQNELAAGLLELGTDPAGSCADVKTRLYVSLDNDGAIRKGTSFPGSPVNGQPFWRTDLEKLYMRGASSWNDLAATTAFSLIACTDQHATVSTTRIEMDRFYMKIPAGATQLKFWVRLYSNNGSYQPEIKFDLDGGESIVLVTPMNHNTPQWVSNTLTLGSSAGETEVIIYMRTILGSGQTSTCDCFSIFVNA